MTTIKGWREFWGIMVLVPLVYFTNQAISEKQRNQSVQESKLFFDELCKKEAGEFIYKTVENVEGVFQMRPRDGSKDYFDRINTRSLKRYMATLLILSKLESTTCFG
jgi:hypothetical protein